MKAFYSTSASLLIAIAAWLVGAILFLRVRFAGEALIAAWLCASALQVAAEVWFCRHDHRIGRAACVLLGQCCAWILGPAVDGRYYRIEELWTLDTGHFGIVTLSLIGGLVGSLAHSLIIVVRRIAMWYPQGPSEIAGSAENHG